MAAEEIDLSVFHGLHSLTQIRQQLERIVDNKRRNRIDFFTPYPKQLEFFAEGATRTERLFMAANRVGKTEAGAYEMAVHLTGLYPPWWPGRKWARPIKAWAAGESSGAARDILQEKLVGPPGLTQQYGTGMIPANCISDWSAAKGVSDAIDTLLVKHYTNGVEDGLSTLQFKSYEQGRKKFQGSTLDIVWFDEEPPEDIYSEGLIRRATTRGMVYLTFTPLLGYSEVVKRFLSDEIEDDGSRSVTRMKMSEAGHFTPEMIEKEAARYPRHERAVRIDGVPKLGSGSVFTSPLEDLIEPRLDNVPQHWFKLWGIDFGIGHPFAAVLIAWDKDRDAIHVLHEIRMKDALPVQHAQAMRRVAGNVPVAWPHDGENREKSSGQQLKKFYRDEGLAMLAEPARYPNGSNETEAGVMDMQQFMSTDAFKVSAECVRWQEEYSIYHRKDGKIVKKDDDLMSATRVAVMARRHARQVPLGATSKRKPAGRGNAPRIASGMDDCLAGY